MTTSQKDTKALNWGRRHKKAAGKARETRGVRRTLAYAATTKGEAQRSIRAFYKAVEIDQPLLTRGGSFPASPTWPSLTIRAPLTPSVETVCSRAASTSATVLTRLAGPRGGAARRA